MESLSATQQLLAVFSGGLVGFMLGLIGGGGSILAVPLLLYLVGYREPHVVIGTTALAVALNAYLNLIPHALAGHVRWKSAVLFAVFGALGAFLGSTLSKEINGHRLLFLFALLMIVVAGFMLRPRGAGSHEGSQERLSPAIALRLGAIGLGAGLLSGFFGIGGGFLIVPGLILATGMPILFAIGTSLFSVGTFGLATAINYAMSGLVDWRVALEYLVGGILGGILGARLASRLGRNRMALNYLFASFIVLVAIYMLYRNAQAFGL
jgi:uncharacterized membrane protein YfcA